MREQTVKGLWDECHAKYYQPEDPRDVTPRPGQCTRDADQIILADRHDLDRVRELVI